MHKIYRTPEPPDGDTVAIEEKINAGLITRPTLADTISIGGRFHAEHVRDGRIIWEDDFDNVVTDEGKKALLDKVLGLQSAFGGIHMGLKDAGGAGAVGDTMATGPAAGGWAEIAATVVSPRLVPTFSAASGSAPVIKTTSAAVSFPILTATGVVIAGCFIVLGGSSVVLNNTGTLYSVGDFTASRTVNTGDTLNVTYTAQLT